MSVFIVGVTAIAFAFEAARYVHAHAVLTHLRHEGTLVDLPRQAGDWIDNGTGSVAAKLQVFTWTSETNVSTIELWR